MLSIFKPWRQGTDLKRADRLWDEEFNNHSFSEEQKQYMHNFNLRYECLDARDDYRAQMIKTGENAMVGSWDKDDGKEFDDDFQGIPPQAVELDDVPIDPLNSGPNHNGRMKEMEAVGRMLTSMGWADPIVLPVNLQLESFTPTK
jgi:hypothetical protein